MAVQQIYFTQISNTGGVAGQVLVANGTAVTWGDANNAAFLGGVAAADYQTEAGLAANVATLAANSATYVLANSGIVSNSSGVFVNGNTGLVVNSVGVHVNATYISTLTANNANNLGGIAAASYVQNTDSRTLSGNLYFTGANNTFSSNLTIEATGELIIAPGAGIYANGGLGTSGQVLTSNATSIYWSTVSGGGGVNTADQYSWTNNHTFNANLTIAATGELIVTAGAGIYANGGLGTSGQYLTSNGSSIYWSTASGGGATLSSNTTSATTHYPAMSTTSTGSWTSAIVSTTKLYFTPSTGQLNATIFNSLSDERVKKNIQTIENALATVNSIRGVRFDWKENDISSIGLIAQEIEQYLPELVHTSNEGEKSVNYGGVVGVLIEAIKELTARIEKLEGK